MASKSKLVGPPVQGKHLRKNRGEKRLFSKRERQAYKSEIRSAARLVRNHEVVA